MDPTAEYLQELVLNLQHELKREQEKNKRLEKKIADIENSWRNAREEEQQDCSTQWPEYTK